MLTALQAQLELGDCGDVVLDYRTVASHCLAPRLVPHIPHECVAMHHQSVRGMTQPEAKKSFLNLIQSWPLHRATIFDVMVKTYYFYLFLFKIHSSNRLHPTGQGCYGWLSTKSAYTCWNTVLETP